MSAVYAHQKATYHPLREVLALDLGLSTLLATDDGELHGRGWMAALLRYDRVLTGIARHRQRLGLRVASVRYKTHVSRLRGWLKSEIHRILNQLIERKKPSCIVVENLNFSSPQLSRRLNRLIQNFGQGVFQRKLEDLNQQYGITIEHRQAAYTSQQCNACGYVDPKNRISQSQFQCKFCSKKCHADVQASRVLRDRRSVASSFSGSSLARKQTLIEQTCLFNQRYTRPRGGPADPRFPNPYYKDWVIEVRSPQALTSLQV